MPPFRRNGSLGEDGQGFGCIKDCRSLNVEHSVQGSFLVALNGDPIHSMDLENVVLDQKSTQVLVESCENLIELRLQCPSLNDLQLVEFNRCRRLESVTIRSGNITDSSLSAVLVRAKQLSFIELEGRGIDGSFLSKNQKESPVLAISTSVSKTLETLPGEARSDQWLFFPLAPNHRSLFVATTTSGDELFFAEVANADNGKLVASQHNCLPYTRLDG